MNFLASSLSDPDVFGPNSESAVNDLYQLLSSDTSGLMLYLLKDLADDLTEQGSFESVSHLLGLHHWAF